MAAVDIAQLLAFAVKNNASDLHLSAGVPPIIRVDGDVKRINMAPLKHKAVHSSVDGVMGDKPRNELGEGLETESSIETAQLGRLRVDTFNRTRGCPAVFRTIPSENLTLDDRG